MIRGKYTAMMVAAQGDPPPLVVQKKTIFPDVGFKMNGIIKPRGYITTTHCTLWFSTMHGNVFKMGITSRFGHMINNTLLHQVDSLIYGLKHSSPI